MNALDTTDRNVTMWQMEASIALVELLEKAYLQHLPPLDWEVKPSRIVGTIRPSYGARDERAEFRRWVDHLKAMPDRECGTPDGTRYLRAEGLHITNRRRRRVSIILAARIDREYKAAAPTTP